MTLSSIIVVVAMIAVVAIAKRVGSQRASKKFLGNRLPGPKGMPSNPSST